MLATCSSISISFCLKTASYFITRPARRCFSIESALCSTEGLTSVGDIVSLEGLISAVDTLTVVSAEYILALEGPSPLSFTSLVIYLMVNLSGLSDLGFLEGSS